MTYCHIFLVSYFYTGYFVFDRLGSHSVSVAASIIKKADQVGVTQ